MNNVVPSNAAQLPAAFQNVGGGDELGAGVVGGFGIVTFKGKVWKTKYRGEEQVLLAPDGRNPRPELEVVIVRAATAISKTYYKDAFVDGSVAPPDCWSVNGVTPDLAAPDRQSPTCAGCKQNAWGSRVTEAGKKAKACSDNKRLVIVPADDIRNESLGGPMMLRVPPTSLQDMSNYGTQVKAKGLAYFMVVTRLRFDPTAAHPKFIFEPVRILNDDEAKEVMKLRESDVTARILDAPVNEVQHDIDTRQEAPEETEAQKEPAREVRPVQGELPLTAVPAAAPTRPLFDPMTGEKIVYPEEKPVDNRPKFDPMTGKPIVYDDAKADQSFPDIPSGLQRGKKAKAVKDEPKPEEAKVGGSFEDALGSLLGSVKK